MPKVCSKAAFSVAVSGAPPDCAMRSAGARSGVGWLRPHSISLAYIAGTPCSTDRFSSTSARASRSGRKRGS